MARRKKNKDYSSDFAFQVAEGFYTAGNNIAKVSHKSQDLFGFSGIMPGAVNMSLALELYLKALHISYGRTPSGHHLWKLFRALPRDVREGIDSQYQQEYQVYKALPYDEKELTAIQISLTRASTDQKRPEESTSISDAKKFFLLHDNAFELWRYLHEIPPEGYVYEFDFGAMDIMINIVRTHTIMRLRERGPGMGLRRVENPLGEDTD